MKGKQRLILVELQAAHQMLHRVGEKRASLMEMQVIKLLFFSHLTENSSRPDFSQLTCTRASLQVQVQVIIAACLP